MTDTEIGEDGFPHPRYDRRLRVEYDDWTNYPKLPREVYKRIFYEGPYWCTSRGNICIIAVLNVDVGDWAAYIGGVRGRPPLETMLDVSQHGAKLTEQEALHWFGDCEELSKSRRGYRK